MHLALPQRKMDEKIRDIGIKSKNNENISL